MAISRTFPTSVDLDNANWVKDAGSPSKWDALDDPWGALDDASYVQCQTNGQRIRFGTGSIPATTSISFVELVLRAIRVGGLSYAQLHYGILSGAVNSGTTVVGLGYSYDNELRTRYTTDPATGAPWTTAGVNGIKPWLESLTQAGFADWTRVASLLIEVDAVLAPTLLGPARQRGSARVHIRKAALQQFRGRF